MQTTYISDLKMKMLEYQQKASNAEEHYGEVLDELGDIHQSLEAVYPSESNVDQYLYVLHQHYANVSMLDEKIAQYRLEKGLETPKPTPISEETYKNWIAYPYPPNMEILRSSFGLDMAEFLARVAELRRDIAKHDVNVLQFQIEQSLND
jgi:hypothetical protein